MPARTSTLAALAAGALAAAGLAATGVLAGTPAAGAAEATRTLSGYETITRMFANDLGKKGPSVGDTLVGNSELRTRKGGARLGTSGADCVQFAGKTEATAKYHCTQTYRLTGGDVVVAGLVAFGETARGHVAIIGGTGRYRGATGQLDYAVVDGGTAFADTFHFDS